MYLNGGGCFVLLVVTLCAVTLCAGFNINGPNNVSNRNKNFNKPLMTLQERASARNNRMNRLKQRHNSMFESFNRPEGTEAFIVPTSNGENEVHKDTDQHGRTFGEYGSYRRHTSWQKAVADDRLRQVVTTNQNFKLTFPWLKNHLQRPMSQGFGIKGFWNSYALPEGGPNVPGLGPEKTELSPESPSPVKTPSP